MAKRYEMTDEPWDLIADLLLGSRRSCRSIADDLHMLNGILWGALFRRSLARHARAHWPVVNGLPTVS